MRAKFIRGQDPKDRIGIGLPAKRFAVEAEKALKEISDEFGGRVEIVDPAWQGEGHVRATIYFPKGYQITPDSRPLNTGYRYKLEYEDWNERPITFCTSVGGNDWFSYYVDSVEEGKNMIKDRIPKIFANNR